MTLLKYLSLAAFLGATIFAASFLLGKSDAFPYGETSGDIQIVLKARDSAVTQGPVYAVRSGDISGEAVLTYAPTAAKGQSLVSSQIVGVQSTFKSTVAPYPGQITDKIECEAKKFLKIDALPFGGSNAEVVFAVASARRIFGICASEDIKFAAAVLAAYDEKRKQVLTVRLFKPLTDPGTVADSQTEIASILRKIIHQPGGGISAAN